MAWSFNRKPFSIAVKSNFEIDEIAALEQFRQLLLPNGDCIISTNKKGVKSVAFEPNGNIIESVFQVAILKGQLTIWGVHRIARRFDYSILAVIAAMFVWGPFNYALAAFLAYAVFAIYLLGRPQTSIQQALESVAGIEPVAVPIALKATEKVEPSGNAVGTKVEHTTPMTELVAADSMPPVAKQNSGAKIDQPVLIQSVTPAKSRKWIYTVLAGAVLFFGGYYIISDEVTRLAKRQVMWQSMKLKEEGLISTEIEVVDVDVPLEAVFSSSYQIVLHMRSLADPDKRGIAPAMVQGNCWSSGCGIQIPGLLLIGVDG